MYAQQARYGKILSYRWFGDGYILAGFTSGFIVVISTHTHEIGKVLFLSCVWVHTGSAVVLLLISFLSRACMHTYIIRPHPSPHDTTLMVRKLTRAFLSSFLPSPTGTSLPLATRHRQVESSTAPSFTTES